MDILKLSKPPRQRSGRIMSRYASVLVRLMPGVSQTLFAMVIFIFSVQKSPRLGEIYTASPLSSHIYFGMINGFSRWSAMVRQMIFCAREPQMFFAGLIALARHVIRSHKGSLSTASHPIRDIQSINCAFR
ncbi:hypothetical protein CHH26_11000 [Qipengyuania flava]|nr:hypothetical protein CHH26_11000 [Qipengyuania flava]